MRPQHPIAPSAKIQVLTPHRSLTMDLADIRIILIFLLICGVTALISSVFGVNGTYFMLTLHSLMNSFFLVTFLIADGKL